MNKETIQTINDFILKRRKEMTIMGQELRRDEGKMDLPDFRYDEGYIKGSQYTLILLNRIIKCVK